MRRIETDSIKAVSILVDSKSQTISGSESHHRDTKERKEKKKPMTNTTKLYFNSLHKPGPEQKRYKKILLKMRQSFKSRPEK